MSELLARDWSPSTNEKRELVESLARRLKFHSEDSSEESSGSSLLDDLTNVGSLASDAVTVFTDLFHQYVRPFRAMLAEADCAVSSANSTQRRDFVDLLARRAVELDGDESEAISLKKTLGTIGNLVGTAVGIFGDFL